MKKSLLTKISAISLGVVACAGIAFAGIRNISSKEAKAASTYVLVDSCDFTTKADGATGYATSWTYGSYTVMGGANNNKGWAYVKMGAKSASLTETNNPAYVASPVFTDSISKVSVVSPAGSLSKSGMSATVYVSVYSDSAYTTVIDTTEAQTVVSTAQTYDFVPTSGDAWAANSYFKVFWSITNTTTTNGVACVSSIEFYKTTESVVPTSIELTNVPETVSVGESKTITATMLPAKTTESVVWSISDESIATISTSTTSSGVSTATITAIGNGTVTVTAHADTTTSVTTTSSEITLNGASTSLNNVVLTTGALGITSSSYAAGTATVDNAVFAYADLMFASDTTSSGVTTYKKGAIQVKASTGALYNQTKFAAGISKVTVVAVATSTNAVVYGGSSMKPTSSDTTAAKANVQINSTASFVFEYTFDTPVNYVTIAATGASYLNLVTLEFDGGAETVSSLAKYINGITYDRSDVIGLCTGAAGNYAIAKTRFLAAPTAVQAEFQTSTDETVVSARTRYETWCNNVGDEDPYGSTIVSTNTINPIKTTNTTMMIIVLSTIALSMVAAIAFISIRKKKFEK